MSTEIVEPEILVSEQEIADAHAFAFEASQAAFYVLSTLEDRCASAKKQLWANIAQGGSYAEAIPYELGATNNSGPSEREVFNQALWALRISWANLSAIEQATRPEEINISSDLNDINQVNYLAVVSAAALHEEKAEREATGEIFGIDETIELLVGPEHAETIRRYADPRDNRVGMELVMMEQEEIEAAQQGISYEGYVLSLIHQATERFA